MKTNTLMQTTDRYSSEQQKLIDKIKRLYESAKSWKKINARLGLHLNSYEQNYCFEHSKNRKIKVNKISYFRISTFYLLLIADLEFLSNEKKY